MSKAEHNERVKLAATYVNNIGVAILVVGAIPQLLFLLPGVEFTFRGPSWATLPPMRTL